MWPAHHIEAGPYRATISGVGGSLAALTYDGEDLVAPVTVDEIRPQFRGAVLAPWPNRVIDGRWSFAGADNQLPINEVERGHALHGLVTFAPFTVVEQEESFISLVAEIPAQLGYPHHVLVEVTYRLDADSGLDWAITAHAMSGPTPIGLGMHPYFTVGGARVDEMSVELPYDEVYLTSGERLLPDEVIPVADALAAGLPDLDLSRPVSLAGRHIDHAFTGRRDEVAVIELRRSAAGGDEAAAPGDGSSLVGVRVVTEAPWVQLFTADRPDIPDWDRVGLAIEPLTCAPAAFNDLTPDPVRERFFPADVLEAGESISLACGISAIV
ncbi:hypothetical protein BSZ39_11635 [Bowdeniella nasicola]|uniref:Aldose 1-epimerase n=2 Tax=Bowdeniella nasicola TaxID=208480 RepID=A0A1Q5PZJ3_9ACTO|nr:hypothetical protein BSZ39_11635 [Bowdeniella nasicola]